jgi:aminoglycoside phosphotransferase (APT) family kinase protein
MKLHSDEIDISQELVKKLIISQFPEWSSVPIERLNSCGTDNVMFRLGEDKVIRLPRIASAAAQIEKEYIWLPQLAPYLSLEIPHPIAKGMPNNDYPYCWLVYKWIEGINASDEKNVIYNAAITLGNFVEQLHKIPTNNAPLSQRASHHTKVGHFLKKLLMFLMRCGKEAKVGH